MGLVLTNYPAKSSQDLIVALVLADSADQDGSNVYPSVKRVAALARCSERTVQYCLKEFAEQGLLGLVKKGGGRGRPSKYQINLDWLSSQPPVWRPFGENGATDAPKDETMQKGCIKGEKRVQKGCKKGARAVAPNPTPTTLDPPLLQQQAAVGSSSNSSNPPTPTPAGNGNPHGTAATTTDPQGDDGESVPADGSSGVAGAGGQVEVEFEDNIKHLSSEILPQLAGLDQATAQAVADELAGGMAAGKIGSPIGWVVRCARLARGEEDGGFTPSRALDVQKAREARKAAEASMQQQEAARLAESARMVEEGRAMEAAAGVTSTREALWRVIGKHPPTPTT